MIRDRRRERRLFRRGRFLAAAAALALTAAAAAAAGDGRVVVIDVDPRVADALVAALSPWSLTIVRAPGPRPASDVDDAAARARVMASELGAGAVVWIAPPRRPDEQATLWVYDAETMELAVRPLTVWAPFDDARAAAVALSVKTLLRASPLLTPEPPASEGRERPTDPAVPTTMASARAPAPPAPTPANQTGAPTPSTAPSASASETASASSMHADRTAWQFEALVGVRAPTGAAAAVEPRAALGGAMWPARFGGHAGVGVGVQAGPGVSVSSGNFQGDLREASFDATARLRARYGAGIAVEAHAGPAFSITSLEGQGLSGGPSFHALRLDPAVDLGAALDFTLAARVTFGAAAVGSALLRFQRYSFDGVPLLDDPAVRVLFGLRLSVEVD